MDQVKWDRRWLGLARHYATWSIDPSTGVGAVIARGKQQVSQGYNGFPAGISDSDERLRDREIRLTMTLHAEHNAILRAGMDQCRGTALYVWPFPPCHRCACDIIQAGIRRVVVPLDSDPALLARWQASLALSRDLLAESGITLVEIAHD